ncbi:hypothetical protein CCR75_007216 [Bremia lactucae]|uniref:Uncharacterized protein n=1 Tax=Bremia lactucae TaxID=4779 RepID=A0A976IBW6_BRELC|nr:hypothetical protein CCR75_007216 [Bremia lactucae]
MFHSKLNHEKCGVCKSECASLIACSKVTVFRARRAAKPTLIFFIPQALLPIRAVTSGDKH